MIKAGLIFLIKTYQNTLSFIFPKACRFYPSCSQYAKEAIEKYGPGKGLLLSVFRLLRCHPFHQGGFDPVK